MQVYLRIQVTVTGHFSRVATGSKFSPMAGSVGLNTIVWQIKNLQPDVVLLELEVQGIEKIV